MSRGRVKTLARRAGIPADPLGHHQTVESYRGAVRGLSDRELHEELGRVLAEQARMMTDTQLLAALRQAQAEADAAAGLNHGEV